MNVTDPDPRDVLLDLALEQELRVERPPDLTERLLGADTSVRSTRSTGRAPRLAIAALVLLATALVVAVWAWPGAGDADRDAQRDGVDEPTPWHHRDLVVPGSVDEALRLVGEATAVEANAFAVRDPATGRLVPVVQPLDNLLAPLFGGDKPDPTVKADDWQQAEWKSLVRDVLGRSGEDARPSAVRPLELLFDIDGRGTLVVGIDDTVEPTVVQVRGMGIAWSLPPGHALPARLRAVLDEPLRSAMESRGLVIGRAGLDRLPDGATRVRGLALTAADLLTLPRFEALRYVDLSLSPHAVTPAALEHLRLCPELRSLSLPLADIGIEHLAPIVAVPALEELFLGGMPLELLARPLPAVANRVDDACAELLTRASQLRELWLPVSELTDAGIGQLAGLPLRTLFVGSPRITGTGFAAFRDHDSLHDVSLIRCDALTDDGFRALVDLASSTPLVGLNFSDCAIPAGGIEALERSGRLRRLGLVRCRTTVGWPRLLAAIARSPSIESLFLVPGDGLLLEDLVHLTGAPALQDLEVCLPPGAQIPADVVRRVRSALPAVGVDVFAGIR